MPAIRKPTGMKTAFAALLAGALLFASCVSQPVAKQEDPIIQRDSLQQVADDREALLNTVFADINAIAENLALIKSREQLISVANTPEGGRRPIEEIQHDLEAIDRLLVENRAKIASLQQASAQLRKANLQIDELEKTIARLTGELGDRTAEVAQLREALEAREHEVVELTRQVEVAHAEVESLSSERDDLEQQLYAVYYIVGAEKELRDAQIINKQGFIGRTLTVNGGSSLASFTQSDARLLSEIPVGHKRVTLVTSHPEGSYQLIQDSDKTVVKVVIDDPVRFWEHSKILVISYK